jgi:hypothetical protein
MDQLEELKKWIELGFEPKPETMAIINKIDEMIKKKESEQTKVLVNPFHKL